MFDILDELLQETELDSVTAESTGFEVLPEGYYLCEISKHSFGESKTKKNPMVTFQFKVVENGHSVNADTSALEEIKSTKNRVIFKYYPFTDTTSVKRFATDMLKFEDENGQSILPKEAFTTSEVLEDALDILDGMRIYINITHSEKDDGTTNAWANLISWKRARLLELPC